jgi:hypothetical protein
MPHVQKLHINAMKAIANAESPSSLPCLKQLVFEVYDEKDFSFLDGAAEGLTVLSIDSAKPSIDLARLCRFRNLTALRLHNAKKNIAALESLKRLETTESGA